MQLAVFVDRVGTAIGARDGSLLAQMMNLTRGCTAVDMQSLSVQSVAQTCQDKLARFGTYAEVVAGIMQARKHLDAQRYAEAYDAQIGAVTYAELLQILDREGPF